jgi:hypothetical protein
LYTDLLKIEIDDDCYDQALALTSSSSRAMTQAVTHAPVSDQDQIYCSINAAQRRGKITTCRPSLV